MKLVSRIEASSTPLILVNPRAVSKEAPVCRAYTQGAPNGTAGIRGISRFLRRGARRCRDDDRSIDRSVDPTDEPLGNFLITRRGREPLAWGRKNREADLHNASRKCNICVNIEIYAFSRTRILLSLVASKLLTHFLYSDE